MIIPLLLRAAAVLAALSTPRLARVTFYQDYGVTASGLVTAPGLAGCSYDIPLFTYVRVDGDLYLCADRGLIGAGVPYSWIDIWAPDGWN